MSKSITLREEGTDSPNIGTVGAGNDSIFNNVKNGMLHAKLVQSLVGHYDADVKFEITDEILERINSKGEATLDVTVGGDGDDDTPYKTVVTLELTWVY